LGENQVTLSQFRDTIFQIKNKEPYIEKLMQKEYVPIREKIAIFQQALDDSFNDENVDAVVRYLNYIKALIEIYTVISTKEETIYDVYDAIQASGALPLIFQRIGEAELKEMNLLYTCIADKYIGDYHG